MNSDTITNLYIDEPHGAKANYPVQFEAWPLSKTWGRGTNNHVHFIWTFGDEEKVIYCYQLTLLKVKVLEC